MVVAALAPAGGVVRKVESTARGRRREEEKRAGDSFARSDAPWTQSSVRQKKNGAPALW